MSDEIKEILELFGSTDENIMFCDIVELNSKQSHLLLDYITNLQQENENLKDFNNKLQATKDRLDKYDKENQLEIDRLNNIVIEVRRYIEEDIEGNYFKRYDDEVYKLCDEVLNILDKENNNE